MTSVLFKLFTCRERYTRQGRVAFAAGRVLSKEKKRTKKTKKNRPTQNTPRNPQPPGDRDQLETARGETRPTRYPTLARFHRCRVCRSRPRTALAISTCIGVNEARWPHTCSRPCAFEEKKIENKNTEKTPPDPKHTTKSTAARRPRPTRDGMQGNTSHALVHTLPLS